tara:strand:+ start:9 stop:1655 length:1647 start_codon:yes stop_codon:yes gene_type:complete
MEYPMTIGLGNSKNIDSLRVIWPNDKTATMENISVNQTLTLKQSEATETYRIPKNKTQKTLLSELPNNQLAKHEENNYNDFDYEGLLGKKISQEGPCVAIGDINGDGNEDIFIGGAKNQPGMLYLHRGNGALSPKYSATLAKDQTFEDTAASFFDADGDGDLDLMVGSGGNQVDEAQRETIRLYLNDGLGNFTKVSLPNISSLANVATLAVHDVDNDGDMDVFIGSRSIVGVYGMDPKHLFLENQGDGTFIDASQKVAATKASGMITNAQWVDINGDTQKELITVSDWGAPRVYTYANSKLSEKASSLNDLSGWWNILYPTDIDGDGDQDFILGNQGKNLHYRPSEENRMKLWVHDFDNNGTFEQIITQTINGKDMPIHQKRELTTQMVSLKKQNLKASEYAAKSIQELFSEGVLAKTTVKEVNTSETILVINDGNGNFTTKKLPSRAQLSCVCGITCTDVNQDGNMDIIMGGNNYEFRPQFSRLDADYGSVLLNNGEEEFTWQEYNTSGFFVKEEIKNVSQFHDKNGKAYVFVAINDEKPKVFEINP